jgi:hypothetical protein
MKTLDPVQTLAFLFFAAPACASAAVVAWQDDVIVRGNITGSDRSEAAIWAPLDRGGEPLGASAMALPEAVGEGADATPIRSAARD